MTEFEKIADEVSGENNHDSFCECAIEWLRGDKVATVTFPSANRYNSKVRKLAEEYPDDVKIRHENKDGSIVATIPVSFIKISPKRAGREMTEEEKRIAGERLKKCREERQKNLSAT